MSLKYDISFQDIFDCERYLERAAFPINLANMPILELVIDQDWGEDGNDEFVIRESKSFILRTWHSLLLAPIYEELIKNWLGLPATLVIGVCEAYRGDLVNLPLHCALYFLGKQGWLGLLSAITLHSMYNLYALGQFKVGLTVGHHISEMVNNTQKKRSRKKKFSKKKEQQKAVPSIKSIVKSTLMNLGATGGAYLGAQVGQTNLGKELGGKAGRYISKVIGTGDYTVGTNSLITGKGPATFGSDGRKTIICNREYLGDVFGSTAFDISGYNLNPGDTKTFPWLSGIANNYDECIIHGLMFEFVSSSADALNSTNTALGKVIMGTKYNSTRPAFLNKIEMENYEYTSSSRPSEDFYHPIECDPHERPMNVQYVRHAGQESDEDPRFYDLGTTYIATVGMQAASNIGELWVTYEIELLKPVYIPGGFSTPLWTHIPITAYTNTEVLGPIQVTGTGNLQMTPSATGSGYDTLAFPSHLAEGTFMCCFTWNGVSTASLTVGITATNCTKLSVFENDIYNVMYNPGTSDDFLMMVAVRITAAGASIQLTSPTLPATGTFGDVFIMQCGETLAGPITSKTAHGEAAPLLEEVDDGYIRDFQERSRYKSLQTQR